MQLIMIDIAGSVYLVLVNKQPPRGDMSIFARGSCSWESRCLQIPSHNGAVVQDGIFSSKCPVVQFVAKGSAGKVYVLATFLVAGEIPPIPLSRF